MAVRSAAEVRISQDELKRQAAWKAVEYVKSGMVLGLGTGSTAAFAVDRIGQLLKDGSLTDIVGVPTSVRTYEQAKGMIDSCTYKYHKCQPQSWASRWQPWTSSPSSTWPSMALTRSTPHSTWSRAAVGPCSGKRCAVAVHVVHVIIAPDGGDGV